MDVKSAISQVFEQRGVEFIFGNPGSTELPFLAGLPPFIDYVMALQEVSVTSMAAGYAYRSGKTPVISLHTAPGLGNAMGAINNLADAHMPAVIVVGQQDSRHRYLDPMLSGDLVSMARPLVKYSHEPSSAVDLPDAFERAFRIAEAGSPGPVMLSVPMDFFEADGARCVHSRTVERLGVAVDSGVRSLADWLAAGERIALITGTRVELGDAWHGTIALAERLAADVFAAPFEAMSGFPSDHARFRHQLPLTAEAIGRVLHGYDRILVLGAPAFRVYPYTTGPIIGPSSEVAIVSDIIEHLTVGDLPGPHLLFGDLASCVRALTEAVPQRSAETTTTAAHGEARPHPSGDGAISVKTACEHIGRLRTDESVMVDEAISSSAVLMRYWPRTRPRGYFRSTDGGLGFALPASVGAALAAPGDRVTCVIGDGAFCYSPQALWTAAQRRLNLKVIVLNNGGYKVLSDYHDYVSAHLGEMPSLKLPGLDISKVAEGFGMDTSTVSTPGELDKEITTLLDHDGPHLLEVRMEWSDRSMFD